MTKLTLEQQELLFANDCKLINLRYEYHGYTGTEKWAIVTELAEEELWVKYPDVIRRYTPFILLSMAQGEVITEYQNYEARERMRRLPVKPKTERKGIVLSLCPRCRSEFQSIPENIVKRLDPFQADKEMCDKCQVGYGYDYMIFKKNHHHAKGGVDNV